MGTYKSPTEINCLLVRESNLKLKILLIATALASAAATAHAQDAAPKIETSAALFGVRESVQQIDISPNGERIVYVTPGRGRVSSAYVANLSGGAHKLVIQTVGNPDYLRWCKFVSNDRLICQASGASEIGGVLAPYSRLIAVGDDGRNVAPLGQRRSLYDARLRQFDGDILDWLPDENDAVLMARDYVPEVGKADTRFVRKVDGMGIDRIDVNTMKTTRVEGAIKAADFFISDGRGNVRVKGYQVNRGGTGQLSSRIQYHYRLPGSMDWQPFSQWEDGAGMAPITVDAGSNSAYVIKKLDGRNALYRVKLDGSMATELAYKHDKVDVDDVVRIGRGSRVIGVTFVEEQRKVVYFDPEYARLAASLGKAIPDLPIINFLGSSLDNGILLIRADSDADPGRFYVYDKARKALNEIMLARPALEHVKLASVKPIAYPASDGTSIPGYLTLPPGKEHARGLPAVVLPHGGPSARDEWGFDWLAQFLAHEGYAVLQPNYRGSAGFGDAWLVENGLRSWRTSVGDVSAGGKWLTTQGIADPARLAIVGWSYGGYAALQSGVTEPGLFKAIVAIAPVTDLEQLKNDARDYTNWQNVVDQVGSGPHVAEGSPLQNADRIKVPVLMFHGSMDQNVRVEHSRRMDAKLRSANLPSELVVYQGLEHSLVDTEARTQMLERISTFLKANTSTD